MHDIAFIIVMTFIQDFVNMFTLERFFTCIKFKTNQYTAGIYNFTLVYISKNLNAR